MKELIFSTRKEAEETLKKVKKFLKIYGRATIADYYWCSMKSAAPSPEDSFIGWTKLRGTKIQKNLDETYSIIFPNPILL